MWILQEFEHAERGLALDNNGIEECAAVCMGVSSPSPWRAGMAGTASNYCNLQDYPINHTRLWEYLRSNSKCCFSLGTSHARKLLIENITGTNFKMFLNTR